MMALLNYVTARDKCPLQIGDPEKTDFKTGDMVLVKNQTPKDRFDYKYRPSFRICKKILDKAFDVQGSTGRVRQLSIKHMQLLNPAEHVLTKPLDLNSFGCTSK